jgi:hypothetical protein
MMRRLFSVRQRGCRIGGFRGEEESIEKIDREEGRWGLIDYDGFGFGFGFLFLDWSGILYSYSLYLIPPNLHI